MQHSTSNLVGRLIVAVLAVCVSICCCQAQLLLSRLSDTSPVNRLAASAAARCARCADKDPASGRDEAPPAPAGGCQLCGCVKDIGPRDAGPVLADARVAMKTVSALPVLSPPPHHVQGPQRAMNQLRRQPPTLVRLHCALIV